MLKQDAVDEWASVEQPYQPWFENTPAIRARVISADGKTHLLDPATIAESPAHQFDTTIYSDARVLSAPLPAVAEGTVVEYQIVVREKAPMLDAGVARRIPILDSVPLRRFHLRIEADASVHLRAAVRLIPSSKLRRESVDGKTLVECDLGPFEVRKDFESNLPPDVPSSPSVAFSTGRSWQAVARRYSEIVDRQISGGDYEPLLDGVDLKGTPAQVAARLTARLHQQIRYTGVEFGEAAIVPNKPAETLKRKYGDCKDKSALLAWMLRAAGLKASLALLDAGWGADTDPDLPGLGVFDHAIVYVASDPPLWIDATAEQTRVGILPVSVQGRLALIAHSATTALVRIPESTAADNWQRHLIEVRMNEYGTGEFSEELLFSGSAEPNLRAHYSDEKKVRDNLESYVKQNYGGSLGTFEVTPRDDFSGPFRIRVQATKAARSNTGYDDAGVAIYPHLLFEELPYPLTNSGNGEEAAIPKKPRERQNDFYMTLPYVYEVRYHVLPPPGYRLSSPPTDLNLKLGPAAYSRKIAVNADGTVDALYRLDTGKRRTTPAEFNAFRDGVRENNQRAPALLAFVPETAELTAVGQIGKAVAIARDLVKRSPESVIARVRLSRLLITAGLGGAAMTEARKAVDLGPQSSPAWQALGWVWQHDTFGRRFEGNWNLTESEKALRKAMEAAPEDQVARLDLAILLEHNALGFRYGEGARFDDAIVLYREVLKKQPFQQVLEFNLALAMLHAQRIDDAVAQLKKCSADIQNGMSSVMTALKEGAPRAIIAAQTKFPDSQQRAHHLFSSGFTLIQLRRYDLANVVLAAAARLANSNDMQTRVDVLSKFKRHEDLLLPATDPRSPVQRMMVEILGGRFDLNRLKTLVTARETWKDLDFDSLRSGGPMLRSQFAASGFSNENIVDLVVSMMSLDKDGDDEHGYRVTASAPGGKKMTMYVAREGTEYRMLGTGGGGYEHIGAMILEFLGKKDLKAAQWWLDKVVADVEPDEAGTGYPAVRSLWSGVTPETRGQAAATAAAYSLIGASIESQPAIDALQAARLKAPNALEESQIDKALCESLSRAKKWSELLVVAKRLAASKTFPEEGFRYVLRAARKSGNWKELELAAQRRLEIVRNNSTALRAMAIARIQQHDPAGAAEWTGKLLKSDLAGHDENIFEAWTAMLTGKAEQAIYDRLKKGGENLASTRQHEYTMAMLSTFINHPEEAQAQLRRAIDQEEYRTLDSRPWVIAGRIAASYGFEQEAAALFERARKAKHDSEEAEWALSLIQ